MATTAHSTVPLTPHAPEGEAAIPFRMGSDEEFRRVRAALARHGYDEHLLWRRQREREARLIAAGAEPEDAIVHATELSAAERADEPAGTDAGAVLVDLFAQARPVPTAVVRRLVDADALAALEALGLLRTHGADGEGTHSSVLLYPTCGVWIASDRNPDPELRAAEQPPVDMVYPALTPNTQHFMRTLPRTPCDALLELCAGTGVAALAGVRDGAREAWSADITARSTAFAEFNARLNGIHDRVHAVCGDLYEPVRGQTFDRIVAHPPYMPAVRNEMVFRDGGADGEEITRRVVAGLPEFLRPGGRFHCVCMATDRDDAPLEQRLRAMLGDAAAEFDVLVVECSTPKEPGQYYARRAEQGLSRFSELSPLLQQFADLHVTGLVYAAVVIDRHAAPAEPLTLRLASTVNAGHDELTWAATVERWSRGEGMPARLLDARLRVADGAELGMLHRHAEGRFAAVRLVVRQEWPFRYEIESPSWVATFLARFDAGETARAQHAAAVAGGTVPADTPAEKFALLALNLVKAGVLRHPDVPLPRRSPAPWDDVRPLPPA